MWKAIPGVVVSASRPEVAKGKVAYSARMRHVDVIVGHYRLFIGSRAKGQTAVATDSVPVEIVGEP